jgi:hypothetical protein
MYSMWTAPSDRDYYDPFGYDEQLDDEREPFCSCGARSDQACEEWCATNLPVEEPQEVEEIEDVPRIAPPRAPAATWDHGEVAASALTADSALWTAGRRGPCGPGSRLVCR